MKKVLSLVLVIAMVLSSMSFAFAAPFTDISDSNYEEAINTLVGLGVIDGYDDGTFRPTATVTRAQMAKMLVVTLGFGDLIAGSTSNFVDTKGHWADAYVGLAAGKGVIAGYPDGTFKPDKTVSYDEALTMLVRALGYTDTCNEIKNMTWPTNFKVKAAELGITNEVNITSGGADRGGIAQLINNALTCALVTVDVDGNVKAIQETSVNKKESYDVQLISRLAKFNDNYTVTEEVLDPNNKKYAGDKVDLAPYMFENLQVYMSKNESKKNEVVFIKESNSLTVEGTVDEVTTSTSLTVLAIEDANGKIQKVSFTDGNMDASELFINGALSEKDREILSFGDDSDDIDFIKVVANEEKDKENGKIDGTEVIGIILTQQTNVGRVEKEYVKDKDIVDKFDLPLDSSDKVDLNKVTVKGEVSSLEDIKVDDVVVEYAAFDKDGDIINTTLVVTRNTIEGKVTRIESSGTTVYVDGTEYSLNNLVNDVNLTLGDTGVFYLDNKGDIADFDGEGSGPANYAVYLGSKAGATDSFNTTSNFSVDKYPQIRLATQDNEAVTYDVYTKVSSKDGLVTDGAKQGSAKKSFVTNNGDKLEVKLEKLAAGELVKYSVNKDGKLTKIEKVGDKIDNVDTTKSSFKLASNAVIFDGNADKDYPVVSVDRLKDTVSGTAVYDSNGNIKVLLATDLKAYSVKTLAYITKLDEGYDNNGDATQVLTAYFKNAKNTNAMTDGTSVVSVGSDGKLVKGVYSFEFDGDVITKADIVTATGIAAKATNVNSSNMVIEGNRIYFADDVTVVEKASDGTITLRSISDIKQNNSVFDYYVIEEEDANDKIGLVVITKR